jgi:hypothetical protein
MTVVPREAQLADIVRQLTEARARVRHYSTVNQAQFLKSPSDHAWSAAQCIQHLSLTTLTYLPIFDNALESGPQERVSTDHRYRADLIGRLLAWFLEPPFRTKTKTTQSFDPIAVAGKAAVIAEFEDSQNNLTTRVERCEGRALERIKVASPFNARAKYNFYSALLVLTAHQRRHLWQADRALEAAR